MRFRMPFTLSFYIGREFLAGIFIALGMMVSIVALGDLVELIRRTSDLNVPFGVVFEMLVLKTPSSAMRVLPFAVLIGSMIALTKLTRTQELVVARAAGISVWQFLLPALLLAFALGVFSLTAFNPLAAALLARFERIEAKYVTGKASLLSVSSSGLWLRQSEEASGEVREHVFHALRIAQKGLVLQEVIVFSFGAHDHFLSRMDAASTTLENGAWHLHDVTVTAPGQVPRHQDEVILGTRLTSAQIQDSFASPMTLSFWQLPAFIRTLEQAGFSALRHRMYWYGSLASPFLLCAMIFIAAVFSLRLPRRGGIAKLVVAGVVTGFGVHFLTNLIFAFGQSGEIPVILAAWAPTLITLMIGGGVLLHLEDG